VLLDDLQFSKRSWHHRNRVYDAKAGWIWLTIPTASTFPTNINQVKVAGKGWIRSHYDRLKILYKGAPYFEDVKALFDLLSDVRGVSLTDYTIPLIQRINDDLGIGTPLLLSSSIEHESKRKTDLLVQMTKAAGGSAYVAQPTAVEEYLDVAKFKEAHLGLELFRYNHPAYRTGGEPYQSVVDLIAYVPREDRLNVIRGGTSVTTLS
jgi:hypothetical protein